MNDLRNSRFGLQLARSRVRPAGVTAYRAYSRLRASGRTPVVFLNSVAKSGTHLVANVLDAVPDLRFSGVHAFDREVVSPGTETVDIERFSERALRVRRGQYFSGHLPYSRQLDEWLAASEVCVLFAYRHPFDIALSLVDFVPRRPDHRLSGIVGSTDSREARIELALFGATDPVTGERLPSVAERLQRHQGWLESPNVTAIRFEDLRGDPETVLESLRRIADAVAPGTDHHSLLPAATGSKSATLNRGTAGRWVDEISDELLDRAMATFGKELEPWGY